MFEYIYSSSKKLLHTGECKYVKRITANHCRHTRSLFRSYGVGYNVCKCCGMESLLRQNAEIAENEIKECVDLLKANGIDANFLRDYFKYYKATMSYSHGSFYLRGKEDNWVLSLNGNDVVLLHNNYQYQRGTTDRHFVGGFHRQELSENTMRFAMRHAATYVFRHYLTSNEVNTDNKEYVAKKKIRWI